MMFSYWSYESQSRVIAVGSYFVFPQAYLIPNSFMKIVGYTSVDIADNHEPKCNAKPPSHQIDDSDIQENDHDSIGNCFCQ